MSVTLRIPVVVDSIIHDLDLDTYSVEIRFCAQSGWGRIRVPRSKLRQTRVIMNELLDAGAILPADDDVAFEYVSKQLALPHERMMYVTRRAGWHGDTFVIEGRSFGPGRDSLRLIRPNRQILDKSGAMGSLRRLEERLARPLQQIKLPRLRFEHRICGSVAAATEPERRSGF